MEEKNLQDEMFTNKESLKLVINLVLAYSDEIKTIKDIRLTVRENCNYHINDILEDLFSSGHKVLLNNSISYYDNDLNYYIYCGIYPLQQIVSIPLNKNDYYKDTYSIQIKVRPVIRKDNLMRMELTEENNENVDELNQNMNIDKKSKRSKERKIGYIIEKVFMWRKMYNGFNDEQGEFIKLTLEEAADRVGISKKSLDDYLIQLRIGKNFGFIFNDHKNDKVGVLRAFVKKHKFMEEKKNNTSSVYNK